MSCFIGYECALNLLLLCTFCNCLLEAKTALGNHNIHDAGVLVTYVPPTIEAPGFKKKLLLPLRFLYLVTVCSRPK